MAWLASLAIRRGLRQGHDPRVAPICFQLYRVPRQGRGTKPRPVTLKLVAGPGDDGRPVVTIMQTNED